MLQLVRLPMRSAPCHAAAHTVRTAAGAWSVDFAPATCAELSVCGTLAGDFARTGIAFMATDAARTASLASSATSLTVETASLARMG